MAADANLAEPAAQTDAAKQARHRRLLPPKTPRLTMSVVLSRGWRRTNLAFESGTAGVGSGARATLDYLKAAQQCLKRALPLFGKCQPLDESDLLDLKEKAAAWR